VTSEGHFGDLLAVVTLSAQLTRDLLAIAMFFLSYFTLVFGDLSVLNDDDYRCPVV